MVTALLCGTCAAFAAVQLWPRLVVRTVPIAFSSPDIAVAVEGAVVEPGKYVLPFGATVGDLIQAAGGLSGDAERSLVNVADPLTAGESVLVPRAATPQGDRRIDVNAADVEELQRLPGIGPVTASRIVAQRPFASLDDLLSVRGIGPKTLERLVPLVRL